MAQTVVEAGVRTPHEQALDRLYQRMGELHSLPTNAQRILMLAEDEDSQVDDLYEVIRSDPILAMRVLRRVNSAYYGLKNKIADLSQAIGLLGFREIRNMALTVYVGRLIREGGDYRNFTREALWSHSVAVAATSNMIANVCGGVSGAEAYIAGLLHDVGLILIDQQLHRHFCSVLDRLQQSTPTDEIEREILTFDHAELGAYVTRQWSFPECVGDAIRYHHTPQDYQGENASLVYVVAMANFLCSRAGWTSLGVQNVASPADKVYEGLGLDESRMKAILTELPKTLEKKTHISSLN